ncbi:MAG: recombination regulator RecX, partial [Candidatus Omnitrophica bacterium]|nr:recombination regulator RecX [Candidatus Omnitrophota bacterium]
QWIPAYRVGPYDIQLEPQMFLIINKSLKKEAWIISLRLLAISTKSQREITKKLIDKGYPVSVVRAVTEKLKGEGLLNDRAYAQHLVNKYTSSKPSGCRRIAFELKRRGIPKKIREEFLASMDSESEVHRARALAQLKWRRFSKISPEKRKKRVYDFLVRRGFDFQIARDLIEEFEMESSHENGSN